MAKKKVKETKKEYSKLLRQEAEDFIKATDKAEAKKIKTEKAIVPKLPDLTVNETDIRTEIREIHLRIDRLVNALMKSKNLKGL
ncbi:MAG: hypothetical protein ACUZ9M_00555 [Candidatus Scalindua sp.]